MRSCMHASVPDPAPGVYRDTDDALRARNRQSLRGEDSDESAVVNARSSAPGSSFRPGWSLGRYTGLRFLCQAASTIGRIWVANLSAVSSSKGAALSMMKVLKPSSFHEIISSMIRSCVVT